MNSKLKASISYRRLSKKGHLVAARSVLRLMLAGRVVLGFGDDDWCAGQELENAGFVASISRRTFNATYTISK